MKLLLCAGVLLVGIAEVIAAKPYRTTHELPSKEARPSAGVTAVVQRVRGMMDAVVFPEVSLSGVTMREAIGWVTQNIPRNIPDAVPADQRGISTVSQCREGAAELITISLRSATLPQVLDAICAQHDYVWRVEAYALAILPREKASQAGDRE